MKYFRLLIIISVVVSALLVFPNRIPEFAGLWLLWCSIRSVQGKLGRVELLAIPAWLLIKWPEPTWAMGVFVATVLVFGIRKLDSKKWQVPVYILWASWAIWLTHHHSGISGSNIATNPGGPVVCLGDSLTDFGYPDELKKLIQQPVADFGFNGYTTVDGLKLVPEIVELKPSVVVIELGGHDYNTEESRASTAANLRRMIESFENAGASVVIVEIARGIVNDPWFGLERQLAREYDLDLIPDTMMRRISYWSPVLPPGRFVSDSWHLSKDGLHPNDAGNRMMAKKVAGYLE